MSEVQKNDSFLDTSGKNTVQQKNRKFRNSVKYRTQSLKDDYVKVRNSSKGFAEEALARIGYNLDNDYLWHKEPHLHFGKDRQRTAIKDKMAHCLSSQIR